MKYRVHTAIKDQQIGLFFKLFDILILILGTLFDNDLNGPLLFYGHKDLGFCQAEKFTFMSHIGAMFPYTNNQLFILKLSNFRGSERVQALLPV